MRVLGLIPARGGSQGVPRKNIKLLHGKPLLAYTADTAQAAQSLAAVVLSTDDAEIAALGRHYGVAVPFLRPAELAQHDTPTLPVVQHAVRWLEEHGDYFDAVCLLQPTNPLRRAEEIDGCIALLEASGADAVVTVRPVPHEYNPQWVYWRDAGGRLALSTGAATPIARRQDLLPAFHRDGSVYVTRRDVIMEQNSLYGQHVVGYVCEQAGHVNIDTPDDWQAAENLLARAGVAL